MIESGIKILQEAFNDLGIPFDINEIRKHCRKPESVKLRRISCIVLTAAGFSRSDIGRIIDRDHATVYFMITKSGLADAPTNRQELKQMENKQILSQIKFLERKITELKSKLYHEPIQRALQPVVTEADSYTC